jgi:hypothetical protein
MRKLFILFVTLLILPLSVHAAVIVDTGTPPDEATGWILNSSQGLAQRFILDNIYTITSLYGFFDPFFFAGGTATMALYADGLGTDGLGNPATVPDTGNELFNSQFTIEDTRGWYGLDRLSTILNPGAYWLAFEVRSNDTFDGAMPDMAPNPLPDGAWSFGGTYYHAPNADGSFPLDLGVRVDGTPVPEPSSILLLASGLIGAFPFYRRFKKTA